MATILVTGATGFVGSHLCARLRAAGHQVRRAVRAGPAGPGDVVVGEIGPATRWDEAVDGVDAVAHLAARVHVMRDRAADPDAAYREVNVEGTLRLAEAAHAAGVGRFLFMSSVKVNGEATVEGEAFSEADEPAPLDPYGRSKLEAERGLRACGVPVVVLRPPLVYGPGVRANFAALVRAVARGLPLPLGAVRNRRSLVYVENLADAAAAALEHPHAAGETFMVSDGAPLSTPELVRGMAAALGRPARLVPVPPALLMGAAALAGRGAAAARLCGSLVVDDRRIRARLGWIPPFPAAEGLRRTCDWFHEARR